MNRYRIELEMVIEASSNVVLSDVMEALHNALPNCKLGELKAHLTVEPPEDQRYNWPSKHEWDPRDDRF